ncbi:hypothetical protein [Demequina sediminicola]|uniref:hypothetical protein n=1 Tax=Demequina sediminicola TaxID=1095026 RepID=UPI000A41FC91|nr:hypothetical protein [Demequina sediminicola]
MSTRAIAPIVGASKDSVHRDLVQVSHHETLTATTADPKPVAPTYPVTYVGDMTEGVAG